MSQPPELPAWPGPAQPPLTLPEILTATEVAQLLGCALSTVEDKARTHVLPSLKIGASRIFPRQALLARLNEMALEHSSQPAGQPAAKAVAQPRKAGRRTPIAPLPTLR